MDISPLNNNTETESADAILAIQLLYLKSIGWFVGKAFQQVHLRVHYQEIV